MLQRLLIAFVLLAGALCAPARAFTPESGFWYNPAEPGSGVALEVQDNYVFLAAYVYDTQGRATWFTAQGFMTGNSRFQSTANSNDGSWLSAFVNGQCIGCAYRAPQFVGGTGGTVSINFTTERTGTLTWGGRTFNIERFDYFLTRTPGDVRTEMMLGEWQIVLDWYNRNGYQNYPYIGDILVFETVDRSTNPDFFDGCRPEDSTDGFCTNFALDQHDASGFYDSATGEHVIVVKDTPATQTTAQVNFAYYVTTGTYQFDGVMEICNSGACGSASPTYYPVRGFRSASRTFVLTGSGPSSDGTKAAGRSLPGLVETLRARGQTLPQGLSAAEVKQRFGIDVAALAPKANELMRRLAP
jgi:hypothetical protein